MRGGLTGGAERGGGEGRAAPALARAPAAAQPQSALRSRAASMTDTLLPAAPQPLEKEGDSYFRKVSGFGQAGNLRAADLFYSRLRRSLQESATGPGGGGGALALGRAGLRLRVRGAAAVYATAESWWLPGLEMSEATPRRCLRRMESRGCTWGRDPFIVALALSSRRIGTRALVEGAGGDRRTP